MRQRLLHLAAILSLLLVKSLPLSAADLTDALIHVQETTPDTAVFFRYVVTGVNYLPVSVQQRMVAGGITILIVPQPHGASGEPEGSHFEPNRNRVVLCERAANDRPGSPVNPRTPITTLHELGHAWDKLIGYYSTGPSFMSAYAEEAPTVPASDRGILSHFLQPTPRGQRECFASLFAARYYPLPDRRLDRLKRDFPKTFQLVRDLPEQ